MTLVDHPFSPSCAECGPKSKLVESEGYLVCTSCGNLIDDNQLKSNQFPAVHRAAVKVSHGVNVTGHKRPVFRHALSLTTRQHETWIMCLCTALDLGFLAKSSLFFLERYVHEIGGAKTTLVMASCVYLAIRQAKKPCSISHVATLVPCSTSSLAKCYVDLKAKLHIEVADVDPTVYMTSYYQKLLYSHFFQGSTYSANVLERAELFLQRSQAAWLDCGRLIGPLCLASVLLSLASIQADFSLLSLKSIRSFCDVLNVSSHSTVLRLNELKQLIHAQLCSLPLFSDVAYAQILDYLDDYVQYEPLIVSVSSTTLTMQPPSRQKNLQKQANLQDRIECAKLWIASQSNEMKDVWQASKKQVPTRQVDALDLSIRQLLLYQVPEERIIQLHPSSMAQLLAELNYVHELDTDLIS